MKLDWRKLIAAVLITEGAGILGSFFTAPKVTAWYAFLDKPTWNPPSWLFAPVWTLLFLLMGIALYRVWRTGLKTEDTRESFWLFIAHLGVNIIWSLVFFGLQSPGWGVVVILTLLAFIAYLIVRFYRIDKLAGWLLVPYIAWVSFATVLNTTVWLLNR